jgi:ribosomal protein L7/L12
MDTALVVLAGLLAVVEIARGALWLNARRHPQRPLVSPDQARAEVLEVETGGSAEDDVRAIKVLRERTGLGLLEAKQTVGRWLQESS